MVNINVIEKMRLPDLDGRVLTKIQHDVFIKQLQSTCFHRDTFWYDEMIPIPASVKGKNRVKYMKEGRMFTGWKVKFCVVCHKALDRKRTTYFWMTGNPIGVKSGASPPRKGNALIYR